MSKFDLISRGTLIGNPETHTFNGSTGSSALVTAGFPDDGPGQAIQVTRVPAADAYGRLAIGDINLGLAKDDWKGLLVEVYNPNPEPKFFSMQLLNTAGSWIMAANMAVEPGDGWQLCFVPKSNFSTNIFTTTAGDTSNTVRHVRYNINNSTEVASGIPFPAGESLYFGRVYHDPMQVPVFLLATDDATEGNVVNGTGYPTGYPASGGNYKSICDYYGFRATAYVRLDKVGSSGYMTWDQLRALRDAGWTIGSHSASHPEYSGNQGLRMLGPYGLALSWPGAAADDSAIYDDVCACRDAMLAQGLIDAWHFALPQGGWDLQVRSACIRAGFKSVRAISSATTGYPVRGSKHVGGGNYGSVWHTGWFELAGAIQVDGTPTLANIQAYIDEVIRLGATGSCYTHGIDATTATKFDGMCAYLKAKQDAGLIRVMTVAEYYDATRDWGGRCKFDGALSSWES